MPALLGFAAWERVFLYASSKASCSDSASTKREERISAFSMAEALDNQGLQVAASFSSNHIGGGGEIRTPVGLPPNGFQDHRVMTASLRLRGTIVAHRRRFVKALVFGGAAPAHAFCCLGVCMDKVSSELSSPA